MTTSIEELWEHGQTDPETISVNGSLMAQATKICPTCGIEMTLNACQCVECGHTECD